MSHPAPSNTVVCPLIVYTDLDVLWLLATFGEVERAGPSTRNMERFPLRDSAVFLTPLADRNTWQDLQTTLSHQL
jgi:hypothetical protein